MTKITLYDFFFPILLLSDYSNKQNKQRWGLLSDYLSILYIKYLISNFIKHLAYTRIIYKYIERRKIQINLNKRNQISLISPFKPWYFVSVLPFMAKNL